MDGLDGAVKRAWEGSPLAGLLIARREFRNKEDIPLAVMSVGPALEMLSPAELGRYCSDSSASADENPQPQAAVENSHRSSLFGKIRNYAVNAAAGVLDKIPNGLRPYLAVVPATLLAAACTSGSPTPLPTSVPANTPTAAPTASPSPTATAIPTSTPLWTPTPTPLVIPSPTPTIWVPPIATFTPTFTPTRIPTATPTATATYTPSPTPSPTPTPTPRPNPAVVYATSIGLGQDKDSEFVVAGLARFGLDYLLDNTEKAFIDAVAANPLEVQLAMVNSTYLTNKTVSLTDLVSAATTMQVRNYHPELKKAVWSMPAKTVQLESSETYNLGSIIKSVASKEKNAIASLDAINALLADNSPFWKTFNEKGDVIDGGTVVDGGKVFEGRYPSGFIYRTTFVPFDAKKWPVREATKNSWQGVAAMVNLMMNKGEMPSNDLDKILDTLGVYPGQCFYCDGKTWDLLEVTGKGDKGNNGYTAYFNMVGSEGNIVREWLKTISDLVWKDSQGLLVRSLLSNNQNDLWLLLSREPRMNNGATAAFANLNVTYMDKTRRPDGTYSSTYQWAKGIVGDAKDERTAVLRIVDWYLGTVTHYTGGLSDGASLYKPVFPQNPTNPPAWAIPLVKQTSSGLNITGVTAALRSLGIPAEGIIPAISNGNAGLIVVNGREGYYDGDNFFNAGLRGINICNVLGTKEQVKTGPNYLGDGSFCR